MSATGIIILTGVLLSCKHAKYAEIDLSFIFRVSYSQVPTEAPACAFGSGFVESR